MKYNKEKVNKLKIKKLLSKSVELFAEMVYPSNIYCICCDAEIDPDSLYSMCDDCLSSVNWANNKACVVCGRALEDWYPADVCGNCAGHERSYDSGLTCFQYKDAERAMIHEFKYHGKSFMARKFAEIMYDKADAIGRTGDIVVPVPMYKEKERKRGYNQAALLAEFTAKKMNIDYNRDILVRVRETAPMSRLSARERKKNLEGAFSVTAEGRKLISGKDVLLVDDIYTMGVTAEYCSRALKEAGAASVSIMSLASGRNQRELPVIGDC